MTDLCRYVGFIKDAISDVQTSDIQGPQVLYLIPCRQFICTILGRMILCEELNGYKGKLIDHVVFRIDKHLKMSLILYKSATNLINDQNQGGTKKYFLIKKYQRNQSGFNDALAAVAFVFLLHNQTDDKGETILIQVQTKFHN